MNNGTNSWDLTAASYGEMFDEDQDPMNLQDEDDLLRSLYSDPEFLADMDARRIEAMEYQMAQHDTVDFDKDI